MNEGANRFATATLVESFNGRVETADGGSYYVFDDDEDHEAFLEQ